MGTGLWSPTPARPHVKRLWIVWCSSQGPSRSGRSQKGRHRMAQIPENVKELLRGGHNVWVATVGEDGWPNVAIKGSGALLDDEHIYFADIFSKKTRDNLLFNSRVAVSYTHL